MTSLSLFTSQLPVREGLRPAPTVSMRFLSIDLFYFNSSITGQ